MRGGDYPLGELAQVLSEDDAQRLNGCRSAPLLRYARASVVGGARGRARTWPALPLMTLT